ncbi:MAG: hypothetical protein AVDCRST_MAG96-370 [uncultured Segetibacter sp.]|uniref:Uncharacterized protein n=1 Tax=uncultured Segetibacter sp. TaxID=481133 RepID=A0A6J4RCP8_9BACT|nr:MAG: hypothetical protein AVDCRST_MAG96-370 [uncultured Segetibacter sp.]
MENKTKKLQWLQRRPANIITTNITAVDALVLKVCRSKAIKVHSFVFIYKAYFA